MGIARNGSLLIHGLKKSILCRRDTALQRCKVSTRFAIALETKQI